MYIYKRVTECDFRGEAYPGPVDGVAVISKSAAGRYCEVMHGGPEFLADQLAGGAKVLTVEEAREIANADPTGYADF
jgi:hypothetical protein